MTLTPPRLLAAVLTASLLAALPLASLASLASLAQPQPAGEAAAFPSKPIKIIVPFTAGIKPE